MEKVKRYQKIFEVVSSEGSVSTKYLSEVIGVSEVTVRRDLIAIEKEGMLPFKRVHGGVIYSLEKIGLEPMFDVKLFTNVEEKQKIARVALKMVEDGDTLFLDSGTTIFYFAKLLGEKRGLKVITVDLKVAEELSKHPNIQTIISCGEVRAGYNSIGGDEAVRFLDHLRAEKAFIATDGWNKEGSFNSSTFEVGVKRKMIELSRKRYLLADRTKYGKVGLVKVCNLDVFEKIITDSPLDPEITKTLSEKMIDLTFE